MDFLDPRHRKAHRQRLFIGYILMSIVVAISTMVILYLAYGYDIDRKTGDLIQNGIVFVDSKPNGAAVYLNGTQQGARTNTRMVLPAGAYTVRLELEGYRHWERSFSLAGGQIQRLVYPYLIPNNFVTNDVVEYDAVPRVVTQSPDRRWALLQKPGQTYRFDVFDLDNPDASPTDVIFPLNILTSPTAESTLEALEWSNDNRHILFARKFDKTIEYIVFDKDNPAESININTLLGISPVKITLKDKKPDQLYFLESATGLLRSADTKSLTISAPLANGVIDYKSYENNLILYATQEGAAAGKTDFKVVENEKAYTLKTVSQSENYIMDIGKYDGEWYYVVGGSAENMAFVYENPLPALKRETKTPLIVTAIMRLEDPRFVSFSANTQLIGLQSGNQLLTLDLEEQRQYRVKLKQDILPSTKLKWMDGYRYIYVVDNQSYVIDFDGSNSQTLVTQMAGTEPMFDRDFDSVYTLEGSKSTAGKRALTRTLMEI